MDPDIYCEKVAPMYWRELGEELSPEQCAIAMRKTGCFHAASDESCWPHRYGRGPPLDRR